MNVVGQYERETQRHVIQFFRDSLGYSCLGNWKDRADNSNIEENLLAGWLERQGNDERIVSRTLHELRSAAALGGSRTLYEANQKTYELLRYGVGVLPSVGEQTKTVRLIDWDNPFANDFAVAEEVTIVGKNTRRPDVVLYVNGIALGVLELKRSTVFVSEGIRQSLDAQTKEYIRPFYSTVQLLMAGNETEGLRYGVIETPEKHWQRWKEAESLPDAGSNPLMRELGQICSKERLLEIVHDFLVFDAGVKKVARHNQYFGVRAAQQYVKRRAGGIIWHTQGSGKSLTMVWLAKWIREHLENARVLIITDRTALDKQIELVFKDVSESIRRTKSGADLVNALSSSGEWLIAALIHKFGRSEDDDMDAYLEEIHRHVPIDFRPPGEIYVFVDECHRTQSGKLHRAMKSLLPEAVMLGFTGTPLLKSDKQRSIETFGPYIHSYKYDEAVNDGAVLDLRYEARDIDQNLTSQDRIDQWFDLKTSGLTDSAKARLKKRWGTMQRVQSSRDRLEKIVDDVLIDMETRDRLRSGRGNAMLVSNSIYSACRIFEMFQETDLKGKCAIVTSYRPAAAGIKGEETGEGLTEKLLQYDIYRKMLAAHFNEPEDAAMHKVEPFEQEVKKRFVEQPGQMKLLIVVDKLLTGFDAPAATYLYIDKPMQDHSLFQAICRVNRLAGEDKEYGHIIDYRDLFKSLERSIREYTGEAFDAYDAEDVKGLLKDRLQQGRERLEEAREATKALCEPVEPPRDTMAYLRYFCTAESGDSEQIRYNRPRRAALYKRVSAFLRAYADLANEMPEAGFSEAEAWDIRREIDHFDKARQEVMRGSGDNTDLKQYEPAMRYLLDSYIRAEESEKLSTFDDLTLIELIVERGEEAINALPGGIRGCPEAVAETIVNNVRRLIVDEMPVNPKYYERMSGLLDDLIQQRRQDAIDYKEYLSRVVELTREISDLSVQSSYPTGISTPALRSLYDNLPDVSEAYVGDTGTRSTLEGESDLREIKAIELDLAIREVKKADWRGNHFKEREIRNAIFSTIGNVQLANEIFEIVMAQSDY